MLRRVWCLVLCCIQCFTASIYAQQFQSLESDEAVISGYKQILESNYKASKKQPKTSYKRELLEFYKTRYESSLKRLDHNHFLLNPTVDQYLKELAQRVADANPGYAFDEVKVVLARYTWPNAFSVGDGTVAINMGLYEHFQNEAQLAFVLCHEFAHYFSNHADERFIRRYKAVNSAEFKARIKDFNKDEYYKTSKLKELLKSNLYSERRHGREFEFEADALGLEFYLNTGFPFREAVNVLNILDSLNVSTLGGQIDIFQTFAIDSIGYASSGIRISQEQDLKEKEQLLTHPDCDKRIEALEKPKLQEGKHTLVDEESFVQVMTICRDEMVHAYFQFKEVDKALLTALQEKFDGPNDVYTNTTIILSMHQLVQKRKDHRLSEVANKPDTSQSRPANQLSNLIFGMRYRHLAKLFYNYSWSVYEWSCKDEKTMHAMIGLARLAGEKETHNDLLDQFKGKYPDSSHLLVLEKME